MSHREHIKAKLSLLPDEPGCYLHKNQFGEVIYVGKAKNLKNRVRSYFTGAHDLKTERLVADIRDFEYIITGSELEALLLEMTLIKKHDPKYNIMLKDDKSYPYLKITNETYPRLITTRKLRKDGGHYFGPYPNAYAANETKRLLDRLYPLRKCQPMPKKICLYYHIGQCLGPCEVPNLEEEQKTIVSEIRRFLSGETKELVQSLQEKMSGAAEAMEFERAGELRDQIRAIESIMNKQNMITADLTSRDVFGIYVDKGWMCVQVFFLRGGKMIERDVSLFPIYGTAAEELESFIVQFYEKNIKPSEIYVPPLVNQMLLKEALDLRVHVPVRGSKRKLLDLATKNAENAIGERFELIARDEKKTVQAVQELADAIDVHPLSRIEIIDNANIQGADAVSALVVFEDGKPLKKEYRKFKIKTVKGPDDYESMREIVRRRYRRLLLEGARLPDLVLIDGGLGQLNAALEVIQDELGLSLPVGSLKKDDKHRTSQLLFGEGGRLIELHPRSSAFYLLQRMQDEVHRFAITFHRSLRSKGMTRSLLDEIPGVGPKRRQQLIRHFGSMRSLKKANIEQLTEAGLPVKLAETVAEYLSQTNEE
ncbi:excinuclease ABC subunit UvrC [Exiguobacterium antarcticum]|uniref:UvrABC system protein C n=1 Tax=Exiguobacterium antarcticum TaxID=132920 RepID=A0ABT6R448_9BACL|nr:excinuclease ABC subunit UvrC [Exiguobacterium antarcticum]AFS71114.1 UvrABC system protein C [Exiguobacterium antarcticum B7]MDI3235557.1 excinuclease ABC subunit UvrC [Exiguobacterium antarcticum]